MRFLKIIITLSICACSSSLLVGAQTPPPNEADRTAEFLFDPFDPPIDRSIAYGDGLAKVRTRFGVPREETSKIARDSQDPTGTSEYLVFYYDGLTIQFEGASYQESRWITEMELVGGDYSLKYGLELKKHRRDFLSILEPSLLNNDEKRIRFDSEYSNTGVFDGQRISVSTGSILIVDFDADGMATKMTWTYYAD
jgi:hypothetical protein